MGDISKGVRVLVAALILVAAALTLGSTASAATSPAGTTFPVSYLNHPLGTVPGANSGMVGPGYSFSPLSSNGRYVLFTSMSDNLVDDADLDIANLFRKDTQTGDVVMVNRFNGPNGASTPGYIYAFDMSADGNLVAFVSTDRLTPADLDDESDVYLRNIAAGTTTLVGPDTPSSVYQTSISADGAYVTITTASALVAGDVNTVSDVYRIRLSDGAVDIVSRIPALPNAGNNFSTSGSISGDGRWIAFASEATNLIAGFTDNNGGFGDDIYVRDMVGGSTYLVSSRFNSNTQGGNESSEEPVIAGEPIAFSEVMVAFDSYATNLADNGVTDTDTASSVYLKSMPAQASELISRATGPAGANADSRAHTPSISDDGSRITFSSDAGNLGPGLDYYGTYVRDRSASTTKLISARNLYAIQGSISGDGSAATWIEAGGGTPDSDQDLMGIFKRDLNSNQLSFVSRPKGTAKVVAPGFNNYSSGEGNRSLSADGRYFVFSTFSSHLSNDPDQREQVYRRDLLTGKIELVSRASGANGAVAIGAGNPSISSNGQLIAFGATGQLDPADTNDRYDVYVRNMQTQTTVLASRADGAGGVVSDEGSSDILISNDGTAVTFTSDATTLGGTGAYDTVYVRNLSTNQTRIASRATGEAGALADHDSSEASLSADGSKVVFHSHATNLSPDDVAVSRSIYLRDLTTNTTLLVSRAPGLAGASLDNYLYRGTISPDGSKVAFTSSDESAVPATAPWPVSEAQVVLRNLSDGANTLVSVSAEGVVGDRSSDSPSLSADGSVVAFETEATNLRPGFDTGEMTNVMVKSMADGQVTGPPVFGRADALTGGSRDPSISENGNCVVFNGEGHNPITGPLGDLDSSYLYVRSGSCQNPKLAGPKLSKVTLKPARFRVSPKKTATVAAKKRKKAPRGTKIGFNVDMVSTVVITIQRKTTGRKVKGKCIRQNRKNRKRKACVKFVTQGKLTRKNIPVGRKVVPFSGRIGKKALKPGKYRIVVHAARSGIKSAPVYRPFRIVRR